MNKLIRVLFIVCIVNCKAQVSSLTLTRGGSQLFCHSLIVYGFNPTEKINRLTIYRFNFQLRKTDSLGIDLQPSRPEDYLQLTTDTLHNFLNIYLYKRDKKEITIVRVDNNFKIVAIIDKVDAARLNNSSMFKNDIYYHERNVYSVVTEGDSVKQFYLNKYTLKSDRDNFDYEFNWQFPFERKDIECAHIFYTNNLYVFMYVWRKSDQGLSQWIVKLNTVNGKLVKATKLNTKGESGIYEYGNYVYRQSDKTLILSGQKFAANELSKRTILNNNSLVTLYVAQIDSFGELAMKQDLKFVFKDNSSVKTKTSYFVRIKEMREETTRNLILQTELLATSKASGCYNLANHTFSKLSFSGENYLPDKTIFFVNRELEGFTNGSDKLDLNGKLCVDNTIHELFFKKPVTPVAVHLKSDSLGNLKWILRKIENKKGQVSFSYLQPVKNIYKTIPFLYVDKAKNPQMFVISPNSFIITQQEEENKFSLQLFKW